MGRGRVFKAVLPVVFVVLGTIIVVQKQGSWKGASVVGDTTGFESESAQVGSDEFPWDEIPGSKELKWHACYKERECARLLVPANYSDPSGPSFNLALIRKRAAVSPDSKDYRGPVLFNPGGPGGSGVTFLNSFFADAFSTILGGQFDIVSFDPRGIARSSPRASFFATDIEREFWGQGLLTSNLSDVASAWARSRVSSQLAEENDAGLLRHINTPNTARDMLSIVEAHGRSKIQYWGFSYGTILGATFAAMFPDKIERFIIDGVADSEDYYSAMWSTALRDTDKALDSFFTDCANAGPEGCAFWAPTPENIQQNLTALIESVRAAPVPIRSESGYGLLNSNLLRSEIFSGLYFPYASFVPLAQGLADLAAGNGKTLFDLGNPPMYECVCHPEGEDLAKEVRDSQVAVLCNDGEEVPDDLKSAQEYFDMMMKVSQWGDLIAAITRLQCIGWPKFPKHPFRGPFVGNTSHPILLIGNTADPVTPLWAAKKMSKGFKDSVVLTQNSAGHCSISAPSLCTQKYIRDYFIDGTLPEPGTVCETLMPPFPSAGVGVKELDTQAIWSTSMTAEERDITEAILELSRNPAVLQFPGFKLSLPRGRKI
ncbi:hypothetical protein BDN70DRAFT_883911 [Pholiota conissans]|uniref:Peptidase S33 tripeptidyl aminopeptidase-like C-terminal domain-containing protein n=1 Tax=Pholiota conissans TaxID=109636 RepID=A0A9P5YSZ4_9AGAR|nr:hypothetical protein BDN70DRAFT_883911 [Pholiota conissans]